jgi:hypothetical protein
MKKSQNMHVRVRKNGFGSIIAEFAVAGEMPQQRSTPPEKSVINMI